MSGRDVVPVGLVAIAFSLAIFFYGGDSTPWLTWSGVILLIAGLIRLQQVFAAGTFTWSAVHWWTLAYVGWLGALIWLSTLGENSRLYFWVMGSFTLVFLLSANLSRERWLWALGLMMISGLLSAGWGLAEFIETGKRANGPIVDPSTWGSLHNMFFFAGVAVLLGMELPRRRVAVLAGAMFIFAAAVACAYSRVANAIFFAALAFTVVLALRYRALWPRVGMAVVVGVMAFVLVHGYAGQDEAAHDEGYTLDIEEKGWKQRLSMWRAGLELYADHPVVGSGPATFKVHYPRYRDENDLRTLGNYVHNDYIQYLAEGGPLLLLFLLAYVGFLGWRLVTASLALTRGDRARLEEALLIVAAGTALAHGLMNFVLFQLPVIILSAFCFARIVKLSGLLEPRPVKLARPALSRIGSVVVSLVLVGVLLADQLSSDLVYNEGGIPFSHKIRDDDLAWFQTMRLLVVLRNGNATNHFAMAILYRKSFDEQRSVEARQALGLASALEYQRGLELNPFVTDARVYYAQFLMANPWLMDFDEIDEGPEALLRKNVELGPTFAGNYFPLADYLKSTGRDDEAYQLLKEQALPWARLKYPGYREDRLALFKRLIRDARARGDDAVLRDIVEIMGGAA